MDDWNKFSGNEENFEGTDNVVRTAPEIKKVKKEKFVTKKAFVITLVIAMLF